MSKKQVKFSAIGVIVTATFLVLAISKNAIAHHPLGGKIPSNFFEGFMSGLAHPIIGLDHFAFVIASGLIAAGEFLGLMIPIGFVLATMIGTLIHLQELNLPIPEIIVSGSVLTFGILLSIKKASNNSSVIYSFALGLIATLAGIFHGYAYGEAIVGAEMTPLLTYLTGFIVIQLSVALGALVIGNILLNKFTYKPFPAMRLCGLVISGIGLVFLSSATMG